MSDKYSQTDSKDEITSQTAPPEPQLTEEQKRVQKENEEYNKAVAEMEARAREESAKQQAKMRGEPEPAPTGPTGSTGATGQRG